MKKVSKKNIKLINENVKIGLIQKKQELLDFIIDNPGVTLNEMCENVYFIDDYEFLKALIALFDEYKIHSDSGYFHADSNIK
jgi:hypothetical protein